jgi:hypothetical protein
MYRLLMSRRVMLTGGMFLAIIAPYAMLHPLSWFALGTACYSLMLTVAFWLRDRESQRTTTPRLKSIPEEQTTRERLQTLIPKETPIQRTAEEDAIYEKLREMNILRRPKQE